MESFAPLPASAAWRHVEARDGFETVFISPTGAGGWRFDGTSVAVEDGVAWAVRYAIEVDAGWATRWAEVWGRPERSGCGIGGPDPRSRGQN